MADLKCDANHLKPKLIFPRAGFVQVYTYLALFVTVLSDAQQQVIMALFYGSNVLACLPTGSGKTLCFWGCSRRPTSSSTVIHEQNTGCRLCTRC